MENPKINSVFIHEDFEKMANTALRKNENLKIARGLLRNCQWGYVWDFEQRKEVLNYF